jgi:hypothetical protein
VGPPREGSSSIEEIVGRVVQWGRDGWTLNESVHMVTTWLGAP